MKDHKIEAELLGSTPPRRIRRRGRRDYKTLCLQLLFVPMIAMTIWMSAWCIHALLVRTLGPVVSCRIENRFRERNSDGDGDGWIYFLSYRASFNGQEIVGREMVDSNSYRSTPEGSEVALKLSPLRPGVDSLLLIPGRNIWGVVWGTGFGSLVMWFGVGAMAWYFCILPIRRRKLIVCGLPAVGRLTEKTRYVDSEARVYYLHYQFKPASSADTISGKQSVRESDWNESKTGQSYTVLYDPKNPENSIIYQFADYEATPT